MCGRVRCALPSKDEADDETLGKSVLAAGPCGKDLVWQRFDDMHHGWVSAREYNTEDNRKRAAEAISIFIDFFKKHLM